MSSVPLTIHIIKVWFQVRLPFEMDLIERHLKDVFIAFKFVKQELGNGCAIFRYQPLVTILMCHHLLQSNQGLKQSVSLELGSHNPKLQINDFSFHRWVWQMSLLAQFMIVVNHEILNIALY